MLNLLKTIIWMRKGNICLQEKKGLLFLMFLPSRKADGSIRLKAQRTAISFVILEEEGNQFEIGKSLPTTDGVQYEIYSDIKLFMF